MFIFQFVFVQSQPNPDPIEMITPSILVQWSFFLLFFYCESGQFVMNQFEEFDDQLYECGWYLFPNEMQKMLVIIMSNTQQPVIIHGLANAFCTREIFKKVNIYYDLDEMDQCDSNFYFFIY